ncbi:WD40/YVTN/BNR-like repeat-containing protein [Acidipila rosea]|uniref:Sortilin (Neurotensin receptor 3) n=1 Tax=Acidipila rosea TaxID=768535 RepID=A0A4R1LAT9_9BACT|nr:sialidase family protein [Acidipila rosea]TCK75578.1 sortilin (neurotensin receptor 3) [Acidipila rosea]
MTRFFDRAISFRSASLSALALYLLFCHSAAVTAQQPPSTAVGIVSAAQAGPQTADQQGRTRLPMEVQKSISFREIGPAISGGRVTAVAGVPGKSEVYYVGAADGGVFRTTDGGVTWKALFQHQSVASIGALAVDPVNPQVIWAGTGEANIRNDVSFGNGIYKSTDGGTHWKHMGLDGSFQISRIVIDPHHPDTVLAAAMGSPWADSAERGIYRTTDGGATWRKVLYIAPAVGISDLAMDPANPQVLFAAAYRFRRTPWSYSDGGPEDAIYKSVDQGQSWQRLSGHGLPSGPVSRIGLAVAPSAPGVVYAVMGANEGTLWRSEDEGAHWTLVSKNEEVDVRPFYFSHIAVDPHNPDHIFALSNDLMESRDGGKTFATIAKQIHGDHHTIWIDPDGTGRIIEGNDGGVAFSGDNGGHWQFLHNLAIAQLYHVSTSNQRPYLVCGGLQDNSAWCGPGRSKNSSGILDRQWFDLNGGDGMYAIPAVDNPDLFYNSTQNGAFMIFDRAAEQVHDIEPYPRDFAGDGVANLPYRFAWNAGFAVSPSNPRVLYAGANVVFKSEDRGRTWKPISPDLTRNDKSRQQSSGGPVMKDNSGAEVFDAILRITPSAKDPKVLWVGTDDGQVQLTRDGGATWTNVTSHISGLPPWGRVESIDVAPDAPGDALITVDRHFSGDFKPYIYRTADYGATWQSVSGDLPQVYAHVIKRDLHNPHMYYAGLENGLYVSWDEGTHWYLFGLGLPNAAVYDLALVPQSNDLVVATHGRAVWILDDLTPFQQFSAQAAQSSPHLFAPADALRFWPWSPVEALGDGAFYGKNPAYGAQLVYYLSHAGKAPGQLVITDAEGHVVRTMKGLHEPGDGENPAEEDEVPPAAQVGQATQHSGQRPEQQEATPSHAAPATQTAQQLTPSRESATAESAADTQTRSPWVPVKPGLQRIYWDLRADGPVRWEAAPDFNKGPQSGALVPPGNYTATLSVDGKTSSTRITVVNDPSSHGTQSEMEARFEATQSVLHHISQLDLILNRLDAIQAQVNALQLAVKGTPEEAGIKSAVETLEKQSKAVQSQITSNAGAAESTLRKPDQLREHLFALDGTLEGADDAPTAAILEQKNMLEPQYRSALERFSQFIQVDLAAFNRAMAEHKLTGVVTGSALQP